jgi:hypothetical protein
MPDITLEIRRIPKPGKIFEIIEAVTAAMKASGRIGLVSTAATVPHNGDRDVVTAIPFSSWDELEELNDTVLSDADFRKQQTAIEELCVKTPTVQALNVIVRGDQLAGNRKYLRRNFMIAKRGEAPALVDTLLQWREALAEGSRPTVQRPVSGNQDLVRVTAGYESLSALMEAGADVASNPAYGKFREQLNRLTVSVMGYNSRIVYSKTG